LYNTETSDYVTLEDIAGFIREGREVQIIDLKSGDDLTRQYLLQIIAEHESRGENVLPVEVLNDLVRSYMIPGGGVMPQFLQSSFEMLRESQSKMLESMSAVSPVAVNPLASIPGFEAMKAQQEAFLKAMTGGWAVNPMAQAGSANPKPASDANTDPSVKTGNVGDHAKASSPTQADDLNAIKSQLAELQEKLSKLG
jgi:polyhydroxyalkanoate synthesis repressor PhaR